MRTVKQQKQKSNKKKPQALETSSAELPIILHDLRSKHTKPISQSSLSSQAKKGWLKDTFNATCGICQLQEVQP